MQIYGGIFAMQLYWNHTSAWVISSKFAAFLQNTFSEEHLWRAASVHLHYSKKHTVSCYSSCFLSLSTVQFHSYTKILILIPFISTLTPIIPTLIPRIPRIPHSVPWFPIPAFTDSLRIIYYYNPCKNLQYKITNKRGIFNKNIKKLLQKIFSWTLKYCCWITSSRMLRFFLSADISHYIDQFRNWCYLTK